MTPTTADLVRVDLSTGRINMGAEHIRRNVAINVRRALPQARPYAPQMHRVAIVAGGPSLASTWPALRDLAFAGAKLVAVNGSYHWLLERNLKPAMLVLLDARPWMTKFIDPPVEGCRYLVASQCAPELLEALEGRDVTLYHCVGDDEDETALDAHYFGHYVCVGGGTTVTLRALALLKMLGFAQIDLFGADSCWLEVDGTPAHHGYAQPENDANLRVPVLAVPHDRLDAERPELGRTFLCDPWMMKQAEDFAAMAPTLRQETALTIHGDGMLAYVWRMHATLCAAPPVHA